MSEVIQNGDAVAAAAANATSSGTLFGRGVIAYGCMMFFGVLATKYMLEASKAAAIEGQMIGALQPQVPA